MKRPRKSGMCQSVRPSDRIVCGGDELTVETGGDVAEEVAEHGRREPAKMSDPKLPSKAEMEAHNMSHFPYRSWCKHCVKGRARDGDARVPLRLGVPWRGGW